MRIWFLITVPLILFSLMGCEREFPATPGEETEGYEIAGRVTDALGNPIANVSIKVYYELEYADNNPPPPTEFLVPNNAGAVRVGVYDGDDQLVRTLYNDSPSGGTILNIEWDKRIGGVFAPSGVYTIQYIVDNEVHYSYPVTVHETTTAVTNANGEFRLLNKHLPIGFYPVPLFNPNDPLDYYGQFRITNFVVLEFLYPNPIRAVIVSLNRGTVSRVNIALE